jgi:hypothetical protein
VVNHCDGCCDARACAGQPVSLEVVVQKHVPGWNPTRNHTGWYLGNVVANASIFDPLQLHGHCFFLCRWTSSRFSLANATRVLKFKYHFRTDLSLGGSVTNFVQKCRCKLTIDLFIWKSRTQNDLCSPLITIYLSCLLVDDSGTNTGKINLNSLPSKAHISQQDTLITFRIINYWNR